VHIPRTPRAYPLAEPLSIAPIVGVGQRHQPGFGKTSFKSKRAHQFSDQAGLGA